MSFKRSRFEALGSLGLCRIEELHSVHKLAVLLVLELFLRIEDPGSGRRSRFFFFGFQV